MLKILIPAITLFSPTAAFAMEVFYKEAVAIKAGYDVNEQIEHGPYIGLMVGGYRHDCYVVGQNKLGISNCIPRFAIGPFVEWQGAQGGKAWNAGLSIGHKLQEYSIKYTQFAPKAADRYASDRFAVRVRAFIFNFEAGMIQERGEFRPSLGLGLGI